MTIQELATSKTAQLELLAQASRAPSLHNIQPWRIQFASDGRITFFAVPELALPVADESGHDRRVSLGCFIEGIALGLNQFGFDLNEMPMAVAPKINGLEFVARFQMASSTNHKREPLSQWILRRQSYRGQFSGKGDVSAVRSISAADHQVMIVSDKAQMETIANLHELASLQLMRSRLYLSELYSWMRFNEADPRFYRDGLSAQAMALSGFEASIASVALKPAVFPILDKLGIGGVLVSEKSQSMSALGMMVFKAKKTEEPLQIGRRFYRAWLRLAEAGVSACPMTSAIDIEATRLQLEKLADLAPDEKIANLMRFGVPPEKYKFPKVARVKVSELLLP